MKAAPEGVAMELPEWAERALEHFRPLPVDNPDPDGLNYYNALNTRFRTRWAELKTEKWRVPSDDDSQYKLLKRNYTHPPGEYVRQCILETALECALGKEAKQTPQKLIDAKKEFDRLNDQISEYAGQLAALFRQRQSLKDTYHLSDSRQHYEKKQLDPMLLFGAFELALKRPEFLSWAYVAKPEIAALLYIATSQSRPAPTWPALLDEVAQQLPRTVTSDDGGGIAVMASNSNKSDWSHWVLLLIGSLENWDGNDLPKSFFLDCLTNNQLANLFRVAFDADSDAPINSEQMRKAKERYRKRTRPGRFG